MSEIRAARARALEALDRVQARTFIHISGLTAILLSALKLNTFVQHNSSTLWLVGFCGLALLMCRSRYDETQLPSIRLLQLVGSLSALYLLLNFPLVPVLPGFRAQATYAALLLGWATSLFCGVACYRVPSLGLIPPVFLLWSVAIIHRVTGLVHSHTLDIAPLPEVAGCIGIGLVILRVYAATAKADVAARDQFSRLVFIFAVCIHLANYFWSAVAKVRLDGSLLAWVTDNNPLYIYLAAIDLNHITFAHWAFAGWIGNAIDRTYLFSNVLVLASQALAILGFLMSKRLLILLLLIFDIMHILIVIVVGANFWPWVILNVAVSAVVVSSSYKQPSWGFGVLAAAFIVVSPSFANVAYLGWYDTGAHNKRYYEAEDRQGRRYYVSPNFFMFYSYPIAHDDYGVPEPQTAFATSMNGGSHYFEMLQAGRSCDTAKLIKSDEHRSPPLELSEFIINYHRMAQTIESQIGGFPYNLRPHHFYVHPGLMEKFDRLDKREVVAYIFRRESVCLSWVDAQLRRQLISVGEYRIELPK